MKRAPFEAQSYPLKLWSLQLCPTLAEVVSGRTTNLLASEAILARGGKGGQALLQIDSLRRECVIHAP